ncbi:MAG: hypothetical protein AAGM22_08750 [Acidobacteriota bacterium]
MSPAVRFQAELTPGRFGDVAAPVGLWRGPRALAIASEVERLSWPGRSVDLGHKLRHRVSLYDPEGERRLGVFDRARFPINDVAFHPTEPVAVIATGAYDGGYLFEGELWLWDWQYGDIRRLLSESREAVRCRWLDERRLAVLLRPRDEEEFAESDDDWERVAGLVVGVVLDDLRDIQDLGIRGAGLDPRLEGLEPIDPATLGFDGGVPDFRVQRLAARESFQALGGGWRGRFWDALWLDGERLAVCHDRCHVEVWNVDSGEVELHVSGDGYGVQLVQALGGVVVHVLGWTASSTGEEDGVPDHSTLYRLRPDRLELLKRFDHAVSLTSDAAGHLLCRDTGSWSDRPRPRRDVVIDVDGAVRYEGDLVHFDSFNHPLRLDGADGLYFLRGTPASSSGRKKLCCVTLDGEVYEMADWDGGERGEHLLSAAAVALGPGSLVRGHEIFSSDLSRTDVVLERLDLAAAEPVRWSHPAFAAVTALRVARGRVFYALTDGTLGVLDAQSGESLATLDLEVDGVPTLGLSLDIGGADGRSLAVGTADGRLLIYRLA